MINILEYIIEIKKKIRSIVIVTLSFVFIAILYTSFFIKEDYEAKTKVFARE